MFSAIACNFANKSGGGTHERAGWSSFTIKLLEEREEFGGGGGGGLAPIRTVTQESEDVDEEDDEDEDEEEDVEDEDKEGSGGQEGGFVTLFALTCGTGAVGYLGMLPRKEEEAEGGAPFGKALREAFAVQEEGCRGVERGEEGFVVVFWGVVKMMEGASVKAKGPEDPAEEQVRGSRVSLPFCM